MNGAGKTSTFKMMTGDEGVSEGDAFLDGFSVKSEVAAVSTQQYKCTKLQSESLIISIFTGPKAAGILSSV